jgi:hypothetical protein
MRAKPTVYTDCQVSMNCCMPAAIFNTVVGRKIAIFNFLNYCFLFIYECNGQDKEPVRELN